MNDLIERQSVLNACEQSINILEAVDRIMDLPSVEQEPCEDAISRQAVLDIIVDRIKNGLAQNVAISQYYRMEVEKLPPVNPQKAKTGQWIAIDQEPHEDYECDKCGYTISTYTANIKPHTEYKYCPNCGARMVGEQEGSEQE